METYLVRVPSDSKINMKKHNENKDIRENLDIFYE